VYFSRAWGGILREPRVRFVGVSFDIGGILGRFMMDTLVLEFFKSGALSCTLKVFALKIHS